MHRSFYPPLDDWPDLSLWLLSRLRRQRYIGVRLGSPFGRAGAFLAAQGVVRFTLDDRGFMHLSTSPRRVRRAA